MDTVKAQFDVTHCIFCQRRFATEDVRANVYKEDRFVGVGHEDCIDKWLNNWINYEHTEQFVSIGPATYQ